MPNTWRIWELGVGSWKFPTALAPGGSMLSTARLEPNVFVTAQTAGPLRGPAQRVQRARRVRYAGPALRFNGGTAGPLRGPALQVVAAALQGRDGPRHTVVVAALQGRETC